MILLGCSVRGQWWPRREREWGTRPGPTALPRDLGLGIDDMPVAVNDQKITVDDFGGSIHADKDVHAVMVLPEPSDLNGVEAGGYAKAV